VRHPGYAGALVTAIATPVALGSLWALTAGGALALLLFVRTVLEDRVLVNELPGYAEYAERTRYRLVPGAW
jgi:protein-S-isoprenylcysteine O-methyltransferase Ste14